MGAKLQRKNIFLVIFLSVITFGIYIPIWFMKLKEVTDTWKTGDKAHGILIYLFLITSLLGAISTLLAFFIPQIAGTFGVISSSLRYINLFFLLTLAFYFRKLLGDYFSRIRNKKISLSIPGTLIFTFLYLQYEINNVLEKRYNK